MVSVKALPLHTAGQSIDEEISRIQSVEIGSYIAGIACEITVNGVKPDRNPIIQAKAQATWVKEFIQEFYHKDIQIQSVIVFPGWYIVGTTKADAWVLEPKALKGFLKNRRQVMDEKDIPMIASNLTRYLRIREKFKRNQR